MSEAADTERVSFTIAKPGTVSHRLEVSDLHRWFIFGLVGIWLGMISIPRPYGDSEGFLLNLFNGKAATIARKRPKIVVHRNGDQ